MGWTEGQTLGVSGLGPALPVEARVPYGKAGLGLDLETKCLRYDPPEHGYINMQRLYF